MGFANGEAIVNLEENDDGTMLTYSVEANVGGKIAQVGSRLIDMTAKKMADIFFGKFSELISTKEEIDKIVKTNEDKIPRVKKSQNKILIYFSIGILAAIAIYLLS